MKINDIFTGIITTKEFMNTKNTTLLAAVGFMPSVLSDCLLLKR